MWRPHLLVRPDERRDVVVAVLVLLAFVASLTLLETARDALFLARLPPSQLPWMFSAVAIVGAAATRLQGRIGRRLGGRGTLSAWAALGGVATLAFFALGPSLGTVGLHALYVWSGTVGLLVLVHLWNHLGAIFSVSQAKRLYGLVGGGAVLGAVVGSAAASLLARVTAPRTLILVAGLGMLATAALALLFGAGPAPRSAPAEVMGARATARFVWRHPYARRLAALLILATASLTIADFLFKSVVASEVPQGELASFLGTISLATSLSSLTVQLLFVHVVVRRAGVAGAGAVLPLMLVVSGLGAAAVGGLGAALAVRAVDATLRHSLHRTAAELLFLPLGEEARRRTRLLLDLVAIRGGQVLGSMGLLLLGAFAASTTTVAVVLVALAAAWLALAMLLRRPYLEVFRARLQRRNGIDLGDLELDVSSLETLVRALGSERDHEVLAALDVLAREGKVDLVPPLILYHPSERVLQRALAVFEDAPRRGVVPVLDRLAAHPSPRVRAAILAVRSVLDRDHATLRARIQGEPSELVRETVRVNSIAAGVEVGPGADAHVEGIVTRGSPEAQVELAEAIRRHVARDRVDALTRLVKSSHAVVRAAALRGLGRVGIPEELPVIVELLGDEALREEAQRILLEAGDAGLAALERRVHDASLPALCRVRIPHAVAEHEAERAAPALLTWLEAEEDGRVRHQVLMALGRLVRRDPTVRLDRRALDRIIERTVSFAFRHLDRRLTLVRVVDALPARRTPGHEALVQLLADEQANAVERLFSLLDLAHRGGALQDIHRGLRSGLKEARASALELLDGTLREPLRSAVVALVDDLPDEDRLGGGGRFHQPMGLDYEGALGEMLATGGDAIRSLVVFHVGEAGLVALSDRLAALASDEPLAAEVAHARTRLGERRPDPVDAPSEVDARPTHLASSAC